MATMHYERRKDGYYVVWSADFANDSLGERKITDPEELRSAEAHAVDVREKRPDDLGL